MAWLIAGGIALFLLGSFLQMMPSRKDKHLAELRVAAARHGLRSRLVKSALPADAGRSRVVYEWSMAAPSDFNFVLVHKPHSSTTNNANNTNNSDSVAQWLPNWQVISNEAFAIPAVKKSAFEQQLADFDEYTALQGIEVENSIVRFYADDSLPVSALMVIVNMSSRVENLMTTKR